MNFGADTDNIANLVKELEANSKEVATILNNIYKKIEGLNGNGWQGKGYEAFASECKAYQTSLKQIPDVISDFAKFFSGTVTTNANTMHEKAKNGYDQIKNA